MTQEEIDRIAAEVVKRIKQSKKEKGGYSSSWNPAPGGPYGDF